MRLIKAVATVLLILITCSAQAAGKASHVIVIVWDGMRPDFVTETTAPALWKMSREGATFTNHHPVYVSSTEVN